jgi:hypothetical protein
LMPVFEYTIFRIFRQSHMFFFSTFLIVFMFNPRNRKRISWIVQVWCFSQCSLHPLPHIQCLETPAFEPSCNQVDQAMWTPQISKQWYM